MFRHEFLLTTGLLLLSPAGRAGDAPLRLPHDAAVFGVAFAPDGRTLYTASDDRTVRAWDAATGEERRRFEGHQGGVLALALSADGRTLASAGRDGTVRLWDARDGREKARLKGHEGDVEGLALSADGTVLASSSSGRSGAFRNRVDVKVFT